jgi:hypothetical protein
MFTYLSRPTGKATHSIFWLSGASGVVGLFIDITASPPPSFQAFAFRGTNSTTSSLS